MSKPPSNPRTPLAITATEKLNGEDSSARIREGYASFLQKIQEIRQQFVPLVDTSVIDKIITVCGHPKFQE